MVWGVGKRSREAQSLLQPERNEQVGRRHPRRGREPNSASKRKSTGLAERPGCGGPPCPGPQLCMRATRGREQINAFLDILLVSKTLLPPNKHGFQTLNKRLQPGCSGFPLLPQRARVGADSRATPESGLSGHHAPLQLFSDCQTCSPEKVGPRVRKGADRFQSPESSLFRPL